MDEATPLGKRWARAAPLGPKARAICAAGWDGGDGPGGGLARRCQVTLNTVIQGAWSLVLARHAGMDDVVFGATVAGRPAELPDSPRMPGMFINNLPLRVAVPAGSSTLEWLGQIQQRSADLRRFEKASLSQVRRWCDVPAGREPSSAPSPSTTTRWPTPWSAAADRWRWSASRPWSAPPFPSTSPSRRATAWRCG